MKLTNMRLCVNRTLVRKSLNSKSFNSLQLIFSEVVGGGTVPMHDGKGEEKGAIINNYSLKSR